MTSYLIACMLSSFALGVITGVLLELYALNYFSKSQESENDKR